MRKLVLFVCLASAPVLSQAPKDPDPAKAKADSEKMVCHREADTGSMIPLKVCKTRAQWAAQREASQRDAQTMMDLGTRNSCGSSAPGGC